MSSVVARCASPPNSSSVINEVNAWFAQTFTAGRSGYLREAQISVEKFGPINEYSGDYTVKILGVNADATPNIGSVLAATVVADEAVGPGVTMLVATFPEGAQASLAARTRYALFVSREAVYVKVGIRYDGANGDPCPGGQMFFGSPSGGNAVAPSPAQDLVFAVLV